MVKPTRRIYCVEIAVGDDDRYTKIQGLLGQAIDANVPRMNEEIKNEIMNDISQIYGQKGKMLIMYGVLLRKRYNNNSSNTPEILIKKSSLLLYPKSLTSGSGRSKPRRYKKHPH